MECLNLKKHFFPVFQNIFYNLSIIMILKGHTKCDVLLEICWEKSRDPMKKEGHTSSAKLL